MAGEGSAAAAAAALAAEPLMQECDVMSTVSSVLQRLPPRRWVMILPRSGDQDEEGEEPPSISTLSAVPWVLLSPLLFNAGLIRRDDAGQAEEVIWKWYALRQSEPDLKMHIGRKFISGSTWHHSWYVYLGGTPPKDDEPGANKCAPEDGWEADAISEELQWRLDQSARQYEEYPPPNRPREKMPKNMKRARKTSPNETESGIDSAAASMYTGVHPMMFPMLNQAFLQAQWDAFTSFYGGVLPSPNSAAASPPEADGGDAGQEIAPPEESLPTNDAAKKSKDGRCAQQSNKAMKIKPSGESSQVMEVPASTPAKPSESGPSATMSKSHFFSVIACVLRRLPPHKWVPILPGSPEEMSIVELTGIDWGLLAPLLSNAGLLRLNMFGCLEVVPTKWMALREADEALRLHVDCSGQKESGCLFWYVCRDVPQQEKPGVSSSESREDDEVWAYKNKGIPQDLQKQLEQSAKFHECNGPGIDQDDVMIEGNPEYAGGVSGVPYGEAMRQPAKSLRKGTTPSTKFRQDTPEQKSDRVIPVDAVVPNEIAKEKSAESQNQDESAISAEDRIAILVMRVLWRLPPRRWVRILPDFYGSSDGVSLADLCAVPWDLLMRLLLVAGLLRVTPGGSLEVVQEKWRALDRFASSAGGTSALNFHVAVPSQGGLYRDWFICRDEPRTESPPYALSCQKCIDDGVWLNTIGPLSPVLRVMIWNVTRRYKGRLPEEAKVRSHKNKPPSGNDSSCHEMSVEELFRTCSHVIRRLPPHRWVPILPDSGREGEKSVAVLSGIGWDLLGPLFSNAGLVQPAGGLEPPRISLHSWDALKNFNKSLSLHLERPSADFGAWYLCRGKPVTEKPCMKTRGRKRKHIDIVVVDIPEELRKKLKRSKKLYERPGSLSAQYDVSDNLMTALVSSAKNRSSAPDIAEAGNAQNDVPDRVVVALDSSAKKSPLAPPPELANRGISAVAQLAGIAGRSQTASQPSGVAQPAGTCSLQPKNTVKAKRTAAAKELPAEGGGTAVAQPAGQADAQCQTESPPPVATQSAGASSKQLINAKEKLEAVITVLGDEVSSAEDQIAYLRELLGVKVKQK